MTEYLKFAPKYAKSEEKNNGQPRALIAARSLDFGPPWLQSVQTAGFFKGNQIKPYYITKNQTIMEIISLLGELLYNSEKESIKDTVADALKNGANLSGADLRSADLSGADLRSADLRSANLSGANIYGADLSGADLSGADLSGANIYGADLSGANLSGAELRSADLSGANLYGADLRSADLSGADLSGANLRSAKNIPFIPMACPSDGAFTAWKRVNDKLICLLVPEDAKRCSATTTKCRCNKAKVISITSIDGLEVFKKCVNDNYRETIYEVGQMVFPDNFDNNRWNECSNGIHFFINKQEAINY